MKQEDNTLILTVGLPRIGKSTWAKSTGYPIVNPDSIRLAMHGQPFIAEAEGLVWEIARIMVRSLFINDSPIVILDACNVTEALRASWIRREWKTYYKVFPRLPDLCMQRARDLGQTHLFDAIEHMEKKYQPLNAVEEQYLWQGVLQNF